MPTRPRSIAFKLSATVLAVTVAAFGLIFAYSSHYAREMMVESVDDNARTLAQATANRIAVVLTGVEKVAENVAYVLDSTEPAMTDLGAMLSTVVTGNDNVFGSTVAFAPYAFDPGRRYFAPYAYRGTDGVSLTRLGGPDYDYFSMDWYRIPRELGRAVWSEPYLDEGGGGVVMTTYSVPISRKGDFLGVVTADLALDWLADLLDETRIFETGYAFLVTRTGRFLAHPDRAYTMRESVFSLAEELDRPGLREIGRRMVRGESDFIPVRDPYTGRQSYLYFGPVASSGWSIGVIFPRAELMAPINELTTHVVLMSVLGLLALALGVVFTARTITGGLTGLAGAAGELAAGNLNAELPERRRKDEVGDLARSFEHMRVSLIEYIENLTETTKAKERIHSELMIAREIQLGILPKIFPAFPERPEFDIFASIESAKEVGGDLYNFFFLDERRFCFVVADVSGKGVPAALFMAVANTLFKTKAHAEIEPGELLASVNDDLAEENDSAMFVTVFLGILDTATGVVRYANGGHNPPVVVRADGSQEFVPSLGQPVLGVFEGFDYTSEELVLAPGDTLVAYTDGVTEAMNPERELFGEERLEKALANLGCVPPKEVADELMRAIREFARGAEQSDDITILALRYMGDACRDE